MKPDPWQQIVLDDWLAITRGKWASLTCGLAVPRQNGKNAVIEIRELYGMIGRGEKILHTAHEVKTARKAFKRLQFFFGTQVKDPAAKFPELNALVTEVRNVNGQEAIYLKNGGSVEIVARSKNSGRGFTVDILIMDEAQEMSEEDLEALMPTTSAAPKGDPQWIFTGTPPGPTANGEIFTRVRNEALAGNSKRLAWHEWSAGPDDSNDDREAQRRVNPATLTGRLQMEVIEGERARFSDEGFGRERMGRWAESSAGSVFGVGKWEACKAPEPQGVRVEVLALSTAVDQSHSTIFGSAFAGDRYVIKPLVYGKGASWLVSEAKALHAEHKVPVAVDSRGPAAYLIPHLEAAGVRVAVKSTNEVLDAHANLFQLVQEQKVSHADYPELQTAVAGATTRPVGDRWMWARRHSTADISPLEAATLAVGHLYRPERVPAIHAWPDDDD